MVCIETWRTEHLKCLECETLGQISNSCMANFLQSKSQETKRVLSLTFDKALGIYVLSKHHTEKMSQSPTMVDYIGLRTYGT